MTVPQVFPKDGEENRKSRVAEVEERQSALEAKSQSLDDMISSSRSDMIWGMNPGREGESYGDSTKAEETAEGQFPKLSLQNKFLWEILTSTYLYFHLNLFSNVNFHPPSI